MLQLYHFRDLINTLIINFTQKGERTMYTVTNTFRGDRISAKEYMLKWKSIIVRGEQNLSNIIDKNTASMVL